MGASVGKGMTAPFLSTTGAFYGGASETQQIPFASNAPSQGGQKTSAMPGAPKLPQNPYADAAWRMQRVRGVMQPSLAQVAFRLPKTIG